MTQKQEYWITDADGAKALVVGADERDRWRVHGWTEAGAPAGLDRVWLQHEETGGRQLFAAEAAPTWSALGWHPAAPPEPVDLTRDPQFVDQPAVPAEPKLAAAPAAEAPKTRTATQEK